MYIELLKQLYYQERKKLEAMWIFQEEAKLRLLKVRKDIADRLQESLTISELLGRSNITDEIKDSLLRDNEEKVKEQIDKNIDNELTQIEKEEKEELRNANYSASEYADYLFQLEKVEALENALAEERLFPNEVYFEQEAIEKEKGQG